MAEPFWERKFRGEPVSLSFDDLSNHRIREIKAAFGDQYGIPSQLLSLILLGDADALTAALWIHGQVIGKPLGNLLEIDWNVSEFAAPDKPKRAAPKGKPGAKTATGDKAPSTETPGNSEASTSSS